MKRLILTGLLSGFATLGWAQTNIYHFSSSPGLTIAGGNPVGVVDSLMVNGLSDPILSVTVTLNILDGFNGGLVAYLLGPDQTTRVDLLLNPGTTPANPFGYAERGLQVTLDDTASDSIQYYGSGAFTLNAEGQLTGTWQPAGTLGDFLGYMANGDWTLFVANTLSGSPDATLEQWVLTITTIPEPGTMSLVLVGLSGALLLRRATRKK